jgi:hypothetical protein
MAFIAFLLATLDIALWAALGNFASLTAGFVSIAILILIGVRAPLTIEVTPEWLTVGKARIERRYLSDISVLEREEYFLTRGRNADPAAYLALRFWLSRGVKIELNDKRDATPYWLISSRNPAALAKALQN